jgi:hypothetical protein
MPGLAPIPSLAEFQQELCGDWSNQDFPPDKHGKVFGGPKNPLSYNIMPLPQRNPINGDGYILKNFKYTERLHFNNDKPEHTLAISARAPNRGGLVNQDARALFYEQQVKFAEGPQGPRSDSPTGDVVHVENGAWLWFPRFVQQDGPYPQNPPNSGKFGPPTDMVSEALQQQFDISIAKQISVPHGNSILALGLFATVPGPDGAGPWDGNARIKGMPTIPDGAPPYPMPAVPIEIPNTNPRALKTLLNADERYQNDLPSHPDENLHPDLTRYPNKPLQHAVDILQPDEYIHWHVTTLPLQNGRGFVTNIPFEQEVSKVTAYSPDYWMLFKGDKKYLAYTQTIQMALMILNRETNVEYKYVFPHITCNTVTFEGKATGPCSPPRPMKIVKAGSKSRKKEKKK